MSQKDVLHRGLAVAHVHGEGSAVLAAGHAQDVAYAVAHWLSFPTSPRLRSADQRFRREGQRGERLVAVGRGGLGAVRPHGIQDLVAERGDPGLVERSATEEHVHVPGWPRRATASLSRPCPPSGPLAVTTSDSALRNARATLRGSHVEVILIGVGPLVGRLARELRQQGDYQIVGREQLVGGPQHEALERRLDGDVFELASPSSGALLRRSAGVFGRLRWSANTAQARSISAE